MSQEPLSDADYELLDRFFAGETSAAENPTVHALLARWPEVGERVQAIVRGVRGLMPDASEVGRSWEMVVGDGLAERTRGKRGGGAGAQVPQEESPGPVLRGIGGLGTRPLHPGIWSTAAALIVGLVVLVVGWNLTGHHIGQRAAPAMLTYTTGNGERANITLPDGGTVALNVASRLDVPLDYLTGHHTVRLVGEGLFTVARGAGTPLTVVAGTTTARVLGTSFVVRRYPTDTAVLVAVRDGKVAVDSTVVTANQLVEVGRSGMPHVRPSDASPFTFATGILTLDGLPLPVALVELGRWYDADVRLGDSTLATQFVKGEFSAGSLVDLKAILEGTFDVRVVRDGRVLTLYSR
jgi:ferric-dicitrate binding protein FerR (iron transport regulator)